MLVGLKSRPVLPFTTTKVCQSYRYTTAEAVIEADWTPFRRLPISAQNDISQTARPRYKSVPSIVETPPTCCPKPAPFIIVDAATIKKNLFAIK